MKYLLIVLLNLILLSGSMAQKLKKDAKADSVLCKEKVAFMNSESETEDDGRLNPNTETARVYYAPDNQFKILVTVGESCGAYCNPYNAGWLYYTSKGKLVEQFVDFFEPVVAIYTVAKTKTYTDYLVFTSNWSRPRGFETGTTYGFKHYRWQNETLTELKAVYTDKENAYNEIYSADLLCQEVKGIGMQYNPKSKTITYTYLSYFDENGACKIVSGKYIYTKGFFVQGKETVVPGKANEN